MVVVVDGSCLRYGEALVLAIASEGRLKSLETGLAMSIATICYVTSGADYALTMLLSIGFDFPHYITISLCNHHLPTCATYEPLI